MIELKIRSASHTLEYFPEFEIDENHFYLLVNDGDITEFMCGNDIDQLLCGKGLYRIIALANNGYFKEDDYWFPTMDDVLRVKKNIQTYMKLVLGIDCV